MKDQIVQTLPAGSRRDFFAAATYSFLALIGAGLIIPSLRYLLSPPTTTSPSTWVEAGELSDLETDTPTEVTFRRNRIDGWKVLSERASAWIVKHPGGAVMAFAPFCTHLGCAYHWEETRRQFMCPCHGSWFDMGGKVLAGPAPRPLDQYQVKIEGDRLWLGAIQQQESKSL